MGVARARCPLTPPGPVLRCVTARAKRDQVVERISFAAFADQGDVVNLQALGAATTPTAFAVSPSRCCSRQSPGVPAASTPCCAGRVTSAFSLGAALASRMVGVADQAELQRHVSVLQPLAPPCALPVTSQPATVTSDVHPLGNGRVLVKQAVEQTTVSASLSSSAGSSGTWLSSTMKPSFSQ
jgi:hypothetical protein